MRFAFRFWSFLLTAVLMTPGISFAGLVISSANSPTVIDFDSTVAGSNNGAFAGAGLGDPPAVGELDSTSWSINGFSSAADLSRGTSTGGIGTGGVYAFDVGGGNLTLGVQPGGSDFTPGEIILEVENGTGQEVSGFDIGYDIWTMNDQARANSFNFAYSTDGTAFTDVTGI